MWIKLTQPKIEVYGNVEILGKLPIFKTPKNGKVILRNNVVINSDFNNTNTALTYRCKFVVGYEGLIDIGSGTMLNGVCLVSYKNVKIGEYCQIASSTLITDTDFHPSNPELRELQAKGQFFPWDSVAKEEIVIGDNVWIGWNCTLLKGVRIGSHSIVAAGSVVLKGNYPERVLLADNPAKIIKRFE